MSGKDKQADSLNLFEIDKGKGIPFKKPPSRAVYNGNNTETIEIGTSSSIYAESTQNGNESGSCTAVQGSSKDNLTGMPTSVFSDVSLLDIGLKQIKISQEDSGTSSFDQSILPTRKISKCFEAEEYFYGEVAGSFSSSSNSKASDPPVDPPADSNIVTEEIPDDSGDGGFVELLYNVVIQEKDLVEILTKIRSNHYTVSECPEELIYCTCKSLFERDYEIEVIDNFGGSLSNHYPVRIIIPTKKKTAKKGHKSTSKFDKEKYFELVKNSVSSRCRSRFVVPVIFFENKFICRSATLSVRKGAVFETATKPEPPQELFVESNILQSCSYLTNSLVHRAKSAGEATLHLINSASMERLRDLDRQILKTLKVEYICDLMIEQRKMYLQAIRVSSSEKINKDIYREFKIEQMPYPGCEFFKSYHKAGREPLGLVFNWDRVDCTTELTLSDDPNMNFPDIDWDSYKTWDVVALTQNYLKILLLRLVKGKGGLLVHCISGWDRTPLLISLLRVSLWADEVVHQNLSMLEMAYLTLAYDWYLFGHNFPGRIHNREEILHFCFDFLPRIASDEFSSTKMFENLPFFDKYKRTFPAFKPGRREVLNDISTLILEIYNEVITRYLKW